MTYLNHKYFNIIVEKHSLPLTTQVTINLNHKDDFHSCISSCMSFRLIVKLTKMTSTVVLALVCHLG